MQRQMGARGAMQPQLYSIPQQSMLQSQLYPLQQYLQQYALQAQMNSLTTNAYLAQLNARSPVSGLAQQPYGQPNYSALGPQPRGQNGPDKQPLEAQIGALQDRLDALSYYIQDQEQAGTLTAAQLRSLRKQETNMTKRLRALEQRRDNNGRG
jgi:hypothetical protein